MIHHRIYLTKSRAGHWIGTVKRIYPNGSSVTVYASNKMSTKTAAMNDAQQFIDTLTE
jgi:hypothetical protein